MCSFCSGGLNYEKISLKSCLEFQVLCVGCRQSAGGVTSALFVCFPPAVSACLGQITPAFDGEPTQRACFVAVGLTAATVTLIVCRVPKCPGGSYQWRQSCCKKVMLDGSVLLPQAG